MYNILNTKYNYYPFGSTTPGRSFTSGSYRYGFNGMEKDDEAKGSGNSYDFGSRIYDPRLGRWLKVDLEFNKSPSWTTYRYGFNNPIRFADPNGDFEIDQATAAAYPKFASYLKNLSTTYTGKPEAFRQAFKQYSQLSDAQVQKMLDYKVVPNGTPIKPSQETPRIVVKDLSTVSANGATPVMQVQNGAGAVISDQPQGVIYIDDDIVKNYEAKYVSPTASMGSLMFEGNVESVASELLLESTVFHEATHYGDALVGNTDQTTSTKEGGKDFESKVYGQDIGNMAPGKTNVETTEDYVKTKDYKGAATKDNNAKNFKEKYLTPKKDNVNVGKGGDAADGIGR